VEAGEGFVPGFFAAPKNKSQMEFCCGLVVGVGG